MGPRIPAQSFRDVCACACVALALQRESVRDTSPCAGKLHFKYTASQSVNSKSDLSLRGPESTAWCTMVPTSGSLHCPMLQFVPCSQGARGGKEGRSPSDTHGSPIRKIYAALYLFLTSTTWITRWDIRCNALSIYRVSLIQAVLTNQSGDTMISNSLFKLVL